MKSTTRKKLERDGWAVGSAADFLGLRSAEVQFLNFKLALTDALRKRRVALKLTQGEVAYRIGSSQSRVAKMEAGDPTVAVDLLLRTLFSLGATSRDIARLLGPARGTREVA